MHQSHGLKLGLSSVCGNIFHLNDASNDRLIFAEWGHASSYKSVGFSDNLPGGQFFKYFCNCFLVSAYRSTFTVDPCSKNSMKTGPCASKKRVIMTLPVDVFICAFVIHGEPLYFLVKDACLLVGVQ